jgi:hypothetical protein
VGDLVQLAGTRAAVQRKPAGARFNVGAAVRITPEVVRQPRDDGGIDDDTL